MPIPPCIWLSRCDCCFTIPESGKCDDFVAVFEGNSPSVSVFFSLFFYLLFIALFHTFFVVTIGLKYFVAQYI